MQSFRGANQAVLLPKELAEAVKTLGQREGATSFMVLLAAWQVLLARYSGQEDISVGTPIAGRTRKAITATDRWRSGTGASRYWTSKAARSR